MHRATVTYEANGQKNRWVNNSSLNLHYASSKKKMPFSSFSEAGVPGDLRSRLSRDLTSTAARCAINKIAELEGPS